MIKNERQYRITKAQIVRFTEALSELEGQGQLPAIHPLLFKAQKESLESLRDDLRRQIQEYDDLRFNKQPIFELRSIEEVPNILIKARIALGLSQKQLAELIKVPEQVIQRYEATDYESASVSRIREIIHALNVGGEENLQLPEDKMSVKDFYKRMSEAGLDRTFLTENLLPVSLTTRLEEQEVTSDLLAYQAAAHIGRVFGWKPDHIFSPAPLMLNLAPIANVTFKVPKRINEQKLKAHTVYSHYIALLISQATRHLPSRPLPTKPEEVRNELLSHYGHITIESLIRYIWDHGMPVIAINPNSFHGACFRDNNRNIILLAQKTLSCARWEFNILHELWHAANGIEQLVEFEQAQDGPQVEGKETERIANQFAYTVLIGKNPHLLADRCIEEAKGSVPLLKRAVETIAKREGVRVDVLANYLAYRLSTEQYINWWGVAESLQVRQQNIRVIIRDIMLEYTNLSLLSKPDLDLIQQAINPREMSIND